MRAVQVGRDGQARVVEVAEPVPGNRALVQMHAVGLCGTDSGIVSGKIAAALPVILGHEGVGVVVRAQPGGLFQIGQRVLVDPAVWCGHCRLCIRGHPNLCGNGGLLGRDFDGLFADYAAVADQQLLVVPDSLPVADGGLLQVLGTCVHALRMAPVFPGDTAVVLGLGVAGQLLAQLLTGQGVTVIGITRSPAKRDLAVRLGIDVAVAPDDGASAVADATDGRGAELVVEAVGSEATMAQAIGLAGHAGTVLVYGIASSGGCGLPYYDLYLKELTIRSSRAATRVDYQRAIELVATGAVQASPLVTATFDLSEAQRALAEVGRPDGLKVLMTAV